MPDASFPPGAVARLGSTAFRLAGRYGTVFLMPPDFRTYVVADDSERVYREYDLNTGEPIRTVLGPELYGRVVGVSGDGTRVAVVTRDGVRVVNVANQRVVFAPSPESGAAGFVLAGNGRRLAVMIRNPDTMQREADGDMEGVYVRSIVVHTLGPRPKRLELRPLVNFGVWGYFSADGRYFAVTGKWEQEFDGQSAPFDGPSVIQVWDVATGAEVLRLRPPDDACHPWVAFGGERILIISSHYRKGVGLYDLATGNLVRKYRSGLPVATRALSPDGTVLVELNETSNELVRRDAEAGTVIDRTKSPFGKLENRYTRHLAIRDDGTVTILQVVGQTVHAWTAPDGQALTQTIGGSVPISAITFTDDGREIRTAAREAVVRRWDAQTGELRREINLPAGVAERMAMVRFGPSDWLLARSRNGSAVYHLPTKKVRLTPPVYEEAPQCESLSVDGWLVSLPTHYLNETDSGVRIEHIVEGGRREIHRFDGANPAAAYDRGRVLLTYDDRDGKERTLVCFRIGRRRAEQVWCRQLPVGSEFQDTYAERARVDSSKVGFGLPEAAILCAPDGATALVVPQRERVPFLIDPSTGNTLSAWKMAVRGPHAVHPTRPILATATPDGDGLIMADWRTGDRLATVLEQCYPHALAWSPDGTRLAASLPDGTAWVFAPGSV
jgi:WD40 repeat protein